MYPLGYMEPAVTNKAASRQDRIDAEAAGWLAAIDCGTADREMFEQWRSSDPAHALAFIRLAQIDRDLAALRETGLSAKSPAPEEKPGPFAGDRRKLLTVGVAGLAAASLGALGWATAATAHEAETGVGERRRLVLASGIALELNTDSRVKWRDRDGVYDVDLLRGEVMLEREPGSARCRILCGRSQIELVAGGRMNTKILPHGFDLAVLEGEASLQNRASTVPVRLPAMRKASVTGGAAPAVATISELEAGAVSAWRQGQLQFNGETLEHAVAEYNRYLSRPMEIADPSIRRIRLGGRFSATDPDEFYRALDAIYGVSARVEPDRVRLMRG